MELLSEFLSFFIEFVFWMFILSVVRAAVIKHKEAEEQEVGELKEKLVKMIHFVKQEKHGDVLYWFDLDDDSFLGQGASVEELTEHVKKRFPTHIFITDNADKFMRAPEWKLTPINELEGMKHVRK